jgi:hypothetical protein
MMIAGTWRWLIVALSLGIGSFLHAEARFSPERSAAFGIVKELIERKTVPALHQAVKFIQEHGARLSDQQAYDLLRFIEGQVEQQQHIIRSIKTPWQNEKERDTLLAMLFFSGIGAAGLLGGITIGLTPSAQKQTAASNPAAMTSSSSSANAATTAHVGGVALATGSGLLLGTAGTKLLSMHLRYLAEKEDAQKVLAELKIVQHHIQSLDSYDRQERRHKNIKKVLDKRV